MRLRRRFHATGATGKQGRSAERGVPPLYQFDASLLCKDRIPQAKRTSLGRHSFCPRQTRE